MGRGSSPSMHCTEISLVTRARTGKTEASYISENLSRACNLNRPRKKVEEAVVRVYNVLKLVECIWSAQEASCNRLIGDSSPSLQYSGIDEAMYSSDFHDCS